MTKDEAVANEPDGVLIFSRSLTPEELERLREAWRQHHSIPTELRDAVEYRPFRRPS